MTFRRGLLLTLVLSGVTAALVMVFWRVFTQPVTRDASASAVVGGSPSVARPTPDPAATDIPESSTAALDVLRDWDRRRAEAWARGDPAALARLYLPGSRAGEGDRRLLAAYVARGLRVEGMHTQVLSAEVRIESRDRLVIAVTDRLSAAVAVGDGRRTTLPRDRATRHTVELVRHRGRWVVREVS